MVLVVGLFKVVKAFPGLIEEAVRPGGQLWWSRGPPWHDVRPDFDLACVNTEEKKLGGVVVG